MTTDTSQTPPECSEPARTEPAGEAGAPTETAHAQAIAAVWQALDNDDLLTHFPNIENRTKEVITAALAPFLIAKRDTARGKIATALRAHYRDGLRDYGDEAVAIIRALTGSASRPDAEET